MKRCPCCNKPFDALAGGKPRIVDAKVVVYCSLSCRDAARKREESGWHFPSVRLPPVDFSPAAGLVWMGVILFCLAGMWLFMRPPPRESVRFQVFQGVQASPVCGGHRMSIVTEGHQEPDEPDPIVANERALEILEQSIVAERSTVWDLEALSVLAIHGHEKAISRLVELVGNQTGPTRRKAAVALARVGRADGLEALRRDSRSQFSSTAFMAATELARLGDRSSMPVMKRFMAYTETRMAAAEAAVFIQYEPAFILLWQTVRFGKRPGDRARAAAALAAAGDARAREVLAELFDDGQFRFMAALGLGRLKDPRAVPVLRKALSNTALRLESAILLRDFGKEEYYRDVIGDLESEHAPTRISAAAAVYVLTVPAGQSVEGVSHG